MASDMALQTRQMEQDATALQADVAAFLQSPQVLSEVLTPEHVGMLRPADSDWSAYHRQCLKRVRDVNALGGPRMHIVWHGTLAKLGRIPMLPDEGDSQHILDAERLVEAWIANMDAHGKVEGRQGADQAAVVHAWVPAQCLLGPYRWLLR